MDLNSEKLPEFNSGIAYLYRMNNLMVAYQKCSLNNSFEEMHIILTELMTELEPRMKKNQLLEAQKCENLCEDFKLKTSQSRESIMMYSRLLRNWMRTLNKIAHELKLIMPDQDDANLALAGGRGR